MCYVAVENDVDVMVHEHGHLAVWMTGWIRLLIFVVEKRFICLIDDAIFRVFVIPAKPGKGQETLVCCP
jgi:hypothetical protein